MELIMNQGNWQILKNKLRTMYPELTDDDMQHAEGGEEKMLRIIEGKLRKTKLEMRKIISDIGFIPDEKKSF